MDGIAPASSASQPPLFGRVPPIQGSSQPTVPLAPLLAQPNEPHANTFTALQDSNFQQVGTAVPMLQISSLDETAPFFTLPRTTTRKVTFT